MQIQKAASWSNSLSKVMYGVRVRHLIMANQKMDTFELWCWHTLLHILWKTRATNRQMLNHMKPDTSLDVKITRVHLIYLDISCVQIHWRSQ